MQLRAIFQEYNIDYREPGSTPHVRGDWLGLICPWCGTGGKYGLGINERSYAASCWKCGIHKIGDVLKELTGEPWWKIKELLGDRESFFHKETPKQGVLKLPEGLRPLSSIHKKYLRNRGFDPDELVKLWGLQCTCLTPQLPWRIFIPVVYRGETISWTTRSLASNGVRYVNASSSEEKLSLKSMLYGEDYCRHALIVVEGPTDVWRIGPGAVATMGVKYTPEQVIKISHYPYRFICFDNEPGAQRQARKLMWELSVFPGKTKNLILETGKDAGEADIKEIKEIRKLVFGDEK